METIKLITRIVLLIPLLLSLFTVTALSQGPTQEDKLIPLSGDRATVFHPVELARDAKKVLGYFDKTSQEVKEALSLELSYKPSIVLIKDKRYFESTVGSPHIAAYAISDRGLIVMDYNRVLTEPFTLKNTLKHELVHLVLGEHLGNKMPKWMNEGVAQLIADSPAEIILSRNTSMLIGAVLSKRLIPLERLSASFPRPRKGMVLAYEESLSFIRHIDNEYGREGLIRILHLISEGRSAEEAFLKVTGEDLTSLEGRWKASLKAKATWFSYLSNHFYELLFVFAALITFLGFLRVMFRIKTYKDDDDESMEIDAIDTEEKAE